MDIFVRTILWPKARLCQEKKQWLLIGDLATSFMDICCLSYTFLEVFSESILNNGKNTGQQIMKMDFKSPLAVLYITGAVLKFILLSS